MLTLQEAESAVLGHQVGGIGYLLAVTDSVPGRKSNANVLSGIISWEKSTLDHATAHSRLLTTSLMTL